MVVHQNITNLAGYFHFLNVRKIPYVIKKIECAQKFFAEVNRKINPEHVQYSVVNSYGKLMEIVAGKEV